MVTRLEKGVPFSNLHKGAIWCSSCAGNKPRQGPRTEPQGTAYPSREGGGGGAQQGDT